MNLRFRSQALQLAKDAMVSHQPRSVEKAVPSAEPTSRAIGPAGRLVPLVRLAAAPQARVKHVAQRVTEEVEGEDQESDRQPGVDCQTRLGTHVLAAL